jgi:hypothetical protein
MEYFSNVGQEGLESIRIGGLMIDQLNWVQAAHIKSQLPLVEDTRRQNKIEAILKKYPHQKVAYLESRKRECLENIERIKKTKGEQETMISEYTVHIANCKMRDQLLQEETDPETIKAIKKKYVPYNVQAMAQQIIQCKESIERCDEVIETEHKSIAELSDYIGRCTMRDHELKNLNVKIG